MSRFRFKGSFVAVSAALLASSLLAACGPGEDEPAGNDQGAAEGELTPIDIGSIPVTDAAIMLLGDQQGFFEDEGLTAEVGNPTAGGSSVVAAIIAGEYEIGYSASLSVFQAIEGGNDLVFIANAVSSHDDPDMGTNDLIVSADSDLSSAKDLEGKTVAVNAAGGFAEMLGKNSVLAAGGDPDQVQWVQLNFPDQLPALQSGQIDGFVAGEPFGTLAREDGESVLTNTLWDVSEDPWVLGVWFASRDAVEEDPELFASIQRAVENSMEYAVDHEEELREIIPEFAGIDEGVAEAIRLGNYAPSLTEEGLQPMVDAALRTGLIEEEVDLASLIWTP